MTASDCRLRLFALTLLIPATVACGARFYKPPSGPGTPAADGASVLDAAAKDCRGVKTFQAAMRLSARGLPGLNVQTGVTADGKLRLLVGATAAPDIWLAGTADQSTLLVRDGNRFTRGRADEIVEALIGALLGPDQFLALLTGCVARDLTIKDAIAYDTTRKITTADADLFLEQINGAWRIVAGVSGDIRVDYRPVTEQYPTRVSVRTRLADGREVTFRLEVQESLADRAIEDKYFQLEIPAGAQPMPLDELRRMFSGR